MFKIENTNLLTPLETIGSLTEEASLVFTKDGLTIKEPDRSMIFFINFVLKPSAFEVYELKDDKTMTIRMSIFELINVLKHFKNDEKLNIDFKDRCEIYSSSKKFTLNTFPDKEIENPPIDSLEKKFTAKIRVSYKELKEVLEDAHLFGDDNTITFIKQKLTFTASSSDSSNEYKKNIEFSDNGSADIEPITAKFGTANLGKMLKRELSEYVLLYYATDVPMKMVFNNENTNLEIITAPRVDEYE
jgi:hypothetical protein